MPKAYTQETFEQKVKEVHNGNIDVSNFKYVSSITTGEAKCNVCGNVWHPRADVLIRGCGCRKCFDKRNSRNKTIPFNVIQNKISGITLNEKTYIDTKHHCEATCDNCGHVWNPNIRDLIEGHGCPICGLMKHSNSTKEKRMNNSINKLKEIYGDLYDFSLIKDYFSGDRKYVKVICKEHGVFETKLGNLKNGIGCPFCNESKLEREVRVALKENKISFEKGTNNRRFKWIELQHLDYYLPTFNLAIECQGKQHFESVETFGGEEELEKTISRDNIKKELCKENNVKLIYYLEERFNKYMNDNDIYFNNTDDLINYINNEFSIYN